MTKTTIALIVFIGYAVIQVITWAIQSSAKRQEQERMRELAERRRRVSTAGGQSGAGGGARTAAGPVRAAPLPDLAARRKAQIEELRRRRGSRKSGGHPMTSIGGPATASPSASPTGSATPITFGTQVTLPSWRSEEEAERLRQAAERRKREATRRAAERRMAEEDAQRQRRLREARARAEEQAEARRLAEQRQQPDAFSLDRGVPAGSINRQLTSRTSLRQLFVLKELLDPPLALRQPGD